MNYRIADRILNSALDLGLDVTLRDRYRPDRGLYGKPTAGLILGCTLMEFTAAAVDAAIKSPNPYEVVDEVHRASVGSLGRHTVIY